jgi:hypothetical protein
MSDMTNELESIDGEQSTFLLAFEAALSNAPLFAWIFTGGCEKASLSACSLEEVCEASATRPKRRLSQWPVRWPAR